jgi:hypothetical protein
MVQFLCCGRLPKPQSWIYSNGNRADARDFKRIITLCVPVNNNVPYSYQLTTIKSVLVKVLWFVLKNIPVLPFVMSEVDLF